MIIKTIAATYDRKFNLGDYESGRFEVSAWADIEPTDNPDECLTKLQEMVKRHVRDDALPLLRNRKQGGVEFAALEEKFAEFQNWLNQYAHEMQSSQGYKKALELLAKYPKLWEEAGLEPLPPDEPK